MAYYLLMSELENNELNELAEDQEKNVPEEPPMDPQILEEMVKAGVLYGRKKSKTHPRMKPYIFTTRNNVELFDLAKTFSALEKAQEVLKETVKKGGVVMLVGTQPAAKNAIKELADKFSFPYVSERWLGGTLTNFKTLFKRIEYFINLKVSKESGKLEKYTKKEQSGFDKEIKRLSNLFGGLERLTKLPELVLIADAGEHEIAVQEAKRMRIPAIAIVNSETSPEIVDYAIPGNSQSKPSVQWLLNKLGEGIENGLREKETIKKEIGEPQSEKEQSAIKEESQLE